MKHVLSVTVENKSGVLSRVSGLISRRGFNIESLSVGPTDDPKTSRITAIVTADDRSFEQIKKQLNKLVSVYKISDLTGKGAVERELVLIKVSASAEKRSELLQIVDMFHASIVDVSSESIMVQAVGEEEQIKNLEDLLQGYGIKEMVRTGRVTMGRDS